LGGGDNRLLGLIQKFFNFNGTPLGVLFFCFAIYICLLILKKGLSTQKSVLLVVAITGGLIFHTTSGLFMLLIIPLSLIITLVNIRRKELKKYLYGTKISEWTILSLSCLVLLVPVSHYVYSAAAALPAETHFGSSIHYITTSIISSIYPLIPLSVLGIYMARNEKRDILTLFGTISILGYLLSILVVLPGNNQYKFVYLSTIAFSFLSIIGLYYAYFKTKGVLRVLGKVLSYTVFIIFFLSIIAIEFRYYKMWGVDKTNFYTENKKIYVTKENEYIDIYEWIRENTTEDAIVIMPLVSKDSDIRPGTINSYIFFIGERLPYVAYGDIYTEGINEYKSRVINVNLFYSENTQIEEKLKILGEFEKFSKERTSILLIPKENLEPISPYLNNLELIYSGKDANLYSFEDN